MTDTKKKREAGRRGGLSTLARHGRKHFSNAGRRGGLCTLARHGRKHFSSAGKRGAAAFWKLYKFVPYGTSDFAVVKVANGEIVSLVSGRRPN